ncbi:cell division protein ZapA [Methylobrevis pamukkalensis]|uniref:Cell division protein ZapA n=1 Tax=Methylobrevis pamukkalensis TaxID=1439726 RepID=A0A1E3H183_9HYPH|nr:cell division protein ZapA [Methylobrevis pamukkalensis]ODN70054.1 Cell division protein ZapA [Methylobrevis pamukkalensis]
MAQVTVTIAGKVYRMACDDGQEEHLLGLAHRLDQQVDELRRVFGEIGDQRLIVMSALTIYDKLAETERRLAGVEAEVAALRESRDRLIDRQREMETGHAQRLKGLAARIDGLAASLAPAEDG